VSNREFKVLESRLVAQAIVIEAMIKQLTNNNLIDANTVVADLQDTLDAPVSINADPVNIASMKYDLSNWQETILHISKNV
jgi:hypothetical protein